MNFVELKKEINCLSFQNVCIGSLVELNANITTENWCNVCEAIAVTGPLCNISLYRILKKKKKKLRSWKILDKHLSAGLPHKHTAFIPQWTLVLTWQFLICLWGLSLTSVFWPPASPAVFVEVGGGLVFTQMWSPSPAHSLPRHCAIQQSRR